MEKTITVPSPEEYSLALSAISETAGAIIAIQANRRAMPVLGDRAVELAQELNVSFSQSADNIYPDFDDMSELTLSAFYEEILYVVLKYRNGIIEAGQQPSVEIPVYDDRFAGMPSGDPYADEANEDVSTVLNSVKELLDKLPKRFRKAIEVILEFLKLTSGG